MARAASVAHLLGEALERFLQRPTPSRYRALRRLVQSHPAFDPDPAVPARLERLAERGQWKSIRRQVERLMPQWCLSPRVHFQAARAAHELGDPDDHELERFLISCCLNGIRSTGLGTLDRPWLVTYPSDAADVLQSLRLRAVAQSLVHHRHRLLDRVTCDDEAGTARYFDVTELLGGRRLEAGGGRRTSSGPW